MGKLNEWAKEQSPYIKIGKNESCEGIYGGYRESSYKGTPLIEYKIGEKFLSSGSARLAKKMDAVKVGSSLKITKRGEGYETEYEVFVDGKELAWDDEVEPEVVS